MSFPMFLFQTVVISLSGVMAPGPITTVTVGVGTRSPRAGMLVAAGHGVVEIPLIIALSAGAGYIMGIAMVKTCVLLAGGLFLLIIGWDMLRVMNRSDCGESRDSVRCNPFAAGILLSAGNAYFLLWWATVGMSLISQAASFGLAGFAAFIVVHWLCDFVWLTVLSAASFRGGVLWGGRFKRAVSGVCGVFLGVFGVTFVVEAARILAP